MKRIVNTCKALKQSTQALKDDQRGMATVEYAIVLVAAAGFAGLLVAILKSDWAKEMLQSIITNAFGGAV